MTNSARLTAFVSRATAAAYVLDRDDYATICDILVRAHPYGDLTDKQAAYVDRLLAKAEQPVQATKRVDLSRINAMFDAASQHLKKPFVVFGIEGAEFRVSKAPATGRNPGCLYVKQGSDYAGKIAPDGRFTAASTMSAQATAIQAALEAFAIDPAAAAQAYGRATGNCCFCAKELTDPVSVEVGYGPICAKRWGLPHRHTGLRAVA